MLFDANGNPMTPSHAVKQGTRYRYYVSRPLIIKDQIKSSAGLRIPAEEIQQLVPSRVRQWLLDPDSIYSATRLVDASVQRPGAGYELIEGHRCALTAASTSRSISLPSAPDNQPHAPAY